MKNRKLNKKATKVYKIFQAMGWQWYNGTPTFQDIKDTMKDLEKSALTFKEASTGRIVARKMFGEIQFSVEV